MFRSSFTFTNAAFIPMTTTAHVTTFHKSTNLAKYEMVAEIQPGLTIEEIIFHFNLLLVNPGTSSA